MRPNRPMRAARSAAGSVSGTQAGGVTQFGRPEMPSPSASSGSARARIVGFRNGLDQPDAEHRRRQPQRDGDAGGSARPAAPGIALSWICGPPTIEACRRRASRCAVSALLGRPRPSPLWHEAHETLLKIGPSPVAGAKRRPNSSSPRTKAASSVGDSPSTGHRRCRPRPARPSGGRCTPPDDQSAQHHAEGLPKRIRGARSGSAELLGIPIC